MCVRNKKQDGVSLTRGWTVGSQAPSPSVTKKGWTQASQNKTNRQTDVKIWTMLMSQDNALYTDRSIT